jgi:ATP-binding cassette subfamily A (ABC1) protein 3
MLRATDPTRFGLLVLFRAPFVQFLPRLHHSITMTLGLIFSSRMWLLGLGILVNTTARYAAPVMINALSNGYAAAGVDGMEIKANNAPLPVTRGTLKVLSEIQNIFAVLFIVIAFSFVPGAVIAFVVKEREASHNSKHQQMISGVSISGYWIASFLWDATVYCVPLTLAIIVIASFDLTAFTGSPCCESIHASQLTSTYHMRLLCVCVCVCVCVCDLCF